MRDVRQVRDRLQRDLVVQADLVRLHVREPDARLVDEYVYRPHRVRIADARQVGAVRCEDQDGILYHIGHVDPTVRCVRETVAGLGELGGLE